MQKFLHPESYLLTQSQFNIIVSHHKIQENRKKKERKRTLWHVHVKYQLHGINFYY